MDDARISRTELETLHVTARGRRHGQHEHARHIDAVRWQLIRRRKGDDEIGFPELPALRPRRRCQRPRVSFGCAARHPSFDQGDLLVGQMALADELSKPGFRLPWRHETGSSGGSNLRRVLLRRRVGQQAERCGSIRMMAETALVENDWRDVAGERDGRRRLGACKGRDPDRSDKDEGDREAPARHSVIMQAAGLFWGATRRTDAARGTARDIDREALRRARNIRHAGILPAACALGVAGSGTCTDRGRSRERVEATSPMSAVRRAVPMPAAHRRDR